MSVESESQGKYTLPVTDFAPALYESIATNTFRRYSLKSVSCSARLKSNQGHGP